jgi:hypothetical protein
MKKKNVALLSLIILALGLTALLISFAGAASEPTGPTSVVNLGNTTKNASSAYVFNISGGYIATLNMSATIQNPRWKAFVGWITGKFTLSDANGSTIFDWTLSTTNGRIYATRNSSTISWTSINCSNVTFLEQENYRLNHTNRDDNITATFDDTSHNPFWVGSKYIAASTCPTLNTYVNNVTSSKFEEMALYDYVTNTVYATILEQDEVGYNGLNYDFQMLVPENGAASFEGSTAYYLYVEIT